eukprot:Anaeramoba_ignava/a349324_30.p3 GENE.a349324_30~~a349324_30.p3  ORF type:complete len:299 (+),score=61.85 a349324_30:1094-1990(+)
MKLISCEDRSFLIITTYQGKINRLVLEDFDENNHYRSVITHYGTPPLALMKTNKISQGSRISVQYSENRKFLSIYDPKDSKLEIYEPEFPTNPLFTYDIASIAMHLVLTDNFFITSSRNEQKRTFNQIDVISKFLSISSTNRSPKMCTKKICEPIVQRFKLGDSETICGILRKNLPSPSICYIWTNESVYELVPKYHPEEVFNRLIEKEFYTEADTLGKTFGLDILSLYEKAADKHFEAGNFDQANQLYCLSNVKTTKIVHQFPQVKRMDVAIFHLKNALEFPEKLHPDFVRAMSDLY